MNKHQAPSGGSEGGATRAALLAQVRDSRSLLDLALSAITEMRSLLASASEQLAEAERSLSAPWPQIDLRGPAGPFSCVREELTSAEDDVAQLAAQGLTNAEISDQLFISQNTVKTHLARIFSKLGMSSRRELTQRALRDPPPLP